MVVSLGLFVHSFGYHLFFNTLYYVVKMVNSPLPWPPAS